MVSAALGPPSRFPSLASWAFLHRQRGFNAFGNDLPFVFSHDGQDLHGQLVGVGIIGRNEIDFAFEQAGDELDVTRQAIKLGDDQLAVLALAFNHGGF
jgi:hypothetical protein